jgi:hypothetical protein
LTLRCGRTYVQVTKLYLALESKVANSKREG